MILVCACGGEVVGLVAHDREHVAPASGLSGACSSRNSSTSRSGCSGEAACAAFSASLSTLLLAGVERVRRVDEASPCSPWLEPVSALLRARLQRRPPAARRRRSAVSRRRMNGEWMSIRSSTLRQASMKLLDLVVADAGRCSRRMRVRVVGHLVHHLAVGLAEPVALFLKKSQCP